mgnify:CR=1 FL=1
MNSQSGPAPTGAEILIDALKRESVDMTFGYIGAAVIPIFDVLKKAEGIDLLLTRHEQAAAFMAATVGRLTGRPGVCLSTLGPGATNLVTGVADAYLSNLPMVALVAQAGGKAVGLCADVAAEDQVAAFFERVLADTGADGELLRRGRRGNEERSRGKRGQPGW